ncbi:MAG: hypothetical protein EA392_00530 [Cryomorphaceae bacterium]|nr:MAG: hypothetical protein EA392_00530 [Cryomorphaceae bacterium]
MATIKIKVSDKVVEKVLWLLSQFNPNDVEIVESDLGFEENKTYLQLQLDRLNSPGSTRYTLEEAEEKLERIIKKHEG